MSFSPDGSTLLTLSDQQRLTLLSMTEDLTGYHYYQSGGAVNRPQHINLLQGSSLQMAETVSDICWHPASSFTNPEAVRLAVTMRDHPIHLIGLDGAVLSSYHTYNQVGELAHSQSLAFNCKATHLYAGGMKRISCFDIERHGFPCKMTETAPRGALFGQRGLVSCLSFNPDLSACFSAGCFDGSVSIYVENTSESVLDIAHLNYAVNQVRWSPCGRLLYMSGRKHDYVHCWDIRGTKKEVGRMSRRCRSQQRLTWDLDPWGRYLACGDEDGALSVFDTNTFDAIHTQQLSTQTVNSVAFHPYGGLLATGVGSSKSFQADESSDSSEASGDELEPVLIQTQIHAQGQEQKEDIYELLQQKRSIVPRGSQKQRDNSALSVWALAFDPLVYSPIEQATMVEESAQVVVPLEKFEAVS
jgi:WD40 repeat protein